MGNMCFECLFLRSTSLFSKEMARQDQSFGVNSNLPTHPQCPVEICIWEDLFLLSNYTLNFSTATSGNTAAH
jgi:hypothetical protein